MRKIIFIKFTFLFNSTKSMEKKEGEKRKNEIETEFGKRKSRKETFFSRIKLFLKGFFVAVV